MNLNLKATSILAIDPGSNGTGVALFLPRETAPAETRVLTSGAKTWEARCKALLTLLLNLDTTWSRAHGLSRVVIEQPQFFDAAGGHMVARRGDLAKLCMFAGMSYGIFAPRSLLVPVYQWKGQLPKAVVNRRIEERLGVKACRKFRTHAWDAVGIGMYVRGDLG